ncbi:hypothetical protein SSIN_1073 [Streptococcus sinensis]|uniref:Uncharacterized protein n=1 Tax=Streptococcus sinensis TaxID=176090 RepID=A0A0A0DGC6_9STRE|nr:hypothetical protein SSIN_1073 [Streptococcus sinensis]
MAILAQRYNKTADSPFCRFYQLKIIERSIFGSFLPFVKSVKALSEK